MKLSDTREAYGESTDKASELTRQLAFAALAVVWIFKTDQPGGMMAVSSRLLWPSALAVLALGFDILQYVYKSLLWGFYNRLQEKRLRLDNEKEFAAPKYFNWPAIACFWIKIVAVVACYIGPLNYLFKTIWH